MNTAKDFYASVHHQLDGEQPIRSTRAPTTNPTTETSTEDSMP